MPTSARRVDGSSRRPSSSPPPATAGIAAAEADLAAIHDLPNPPEIRSQHGVLSGTLTIAPAQVTVAGRRTTSNFINGDFVPPTLRVRRGDMIEVRAVNRIGKAAENIDGPQPTNIHYHGMDVSPIPPGDSVFVRIGPERRFGYQVYVPTTRRACTGTRPTCTTSSTTRSAPACRGC
jgi:suppressor of ftsI